jgi:hypothetical protein
MTANRKARTLLDTTNPDVGFVVPMRGTPCSGMLHSNILVIRVPGRGELAEQKESILPVPKRNYVFHTL